MLQNKLPQWGGQLYRPFPLRLVFRASTSVLTWLLNRQTRSNPVGRGWRRLDDPVGLGSVLNLLVVRRHG